MGLAEKQPRHDNKADERHLDQCHRHLDIAAEFYSVVIEPCQRKNQYNSKQLAVADLERPSVGTDGERYGKEHGVQRRKKVRKVKKEFNGKGCNGYDFCDPHLRPTV